MSKTSIISEREILEQLLKKMMELHSFQYTTLDEAKKTVRVGDAECCFDALSLCIIESNLSQEADSELKKMLGLYYTDNFSGEAQKERIERTSLLRYLTIDPCQIKDYSIAKAVRPDFVLTGNGQKVGIEVVELTTPGDQVLYAISKENYGRGKTVDEIKKSADKKHGAKAGNYEYWSTNGSTCISTRTFNVTAKQKHYADQLYRKYQKYRTDISSFDHFIILGDTLRTGDITVSREGDVKAIFDYLRGHDDVIGVTFAVMWQQSNEPGFVVSQYDA